METQEAWDASQWMRIDMREKNDRLISLNVAKRSDDYFRKRSGRADVPKDLRILKKAGRKNPPIPGDERP